MNRLEAIKARLMSTTPWPWRVSRAELDERPHTVDVCDLVNNAWVVSPGPLKAWVDDGELIAHAPEDLDFLLKEVQLLRKALEEVVSESVFEARRSQSNQPTLPHKAALKALADHDDRVKGKIG